TVYKVHSAEEALEVANQTEFGLSSAVWTTNVEEQEWCLRNVAAGAVFINGMTVSYQELPFGGIKNSGYGRELAAEGIRGCCYVRTVWRAYPSLGAKLCDTHCTCL